MSRLVILVVEDESAVRDAVVRDLAPFETVFSVEPAEDAADALSALADAADRGDIVALVIADHLLPGVQGTDFLIELNQTPEGHVMKKMLLTGQAGHDDTIRAINEADLDHYISKPWDPEELRDVARTLLTDYVLEHVTEVLPFVPVLDGPRLMEALARRATGP